MLLEIGREGEPGKLTEWAGESALVIGRGRAADMMISDPLLSRRHCQMELKGGVVFIVDLGSANGTFVNGIETTRSTVQPGDVVTFGKSWLRLVPEAAQVTLGRDEGPSTEKVDPRTARTSPDRKAVRVDEPDYPEIEGYEISGTIGKGSFGTVYRAKHRVSSRDVAIKVIPTGASAKPEAVARFLREIEATGQLKHPNLVQVYGANEGLHFAYLVMEYVEGKTLAHRLQETGKFELKAALEIGWQIASALEHAFSRGYVHRDVKPENILVDAAGTAKLCDFGLVKNLAASSAQHLTRPGQGFGSLAYMPPEQVRDAVRADQRADVYSLGATLYSLLTGRRPFSGPVNKWFLKRVLEDTPEPIHSIEPAIPREVCAIVERCMQKDPAARYPTPRALREAIEGVIVGVAIAEPQEGLAPARQTFARAATDPVYDAAAKAAAAGLAGAEAKAAAAGESGAGRDALAVPVAPAPGGGPTPAPASADVAAASRRARSERSRPPSKDAEALAEFAMDLGPISTDSHPFLERPGAAGPGKAAVEPVPAPAPAPEPAPAPSPAAPDSPDHRPSEPPPGGCGLAGKIAWRLFKGGKGALILAAGLSIAAAALLSAPVAAQVRGRSEEDPAGRLAKAKLPGVARGWRSIDDSEVPYSSVRAIAGRLGVEIEKMANQLFETPTGKLQVSTMLAPSEEAASRLERAVASAAAANTVVRKGRVVYELIASSVKTKEAAVEQLPVPSHVFAEAMDRIHYPGSTLARYRAEIRVARLDSPDEVAARRLSNLLVSTGGRPAASARRDIAGLAAQVRPVGAVPGRSWLAKTGSGEIAGWRFREAFVVWCEVYVRGRGWIGLDLGAGREAGEAGGPDFEEPWEGAAVTADYLPFFLLEDGALPILFCAEPDLERVPRPVVVRK